MRKEKLLTSSQFFNSKKLKPLPVSLTYETPPSFNLPNITFWEVGLLVADFAILLISFNENLPVATLCKYSLTASSSLAIILCPFFKINSPVLSKSVSIFFLAALPELTNAPFSLLIILNNL